MKEEKIEFPCISCGKKTVLCPECGGDDPYVKDGQYDGFQLCRDKNCESYQFCCGC